MDFDGTLCKEAYPDIGEPKLYVIKRLKEEQRLGAKVILWTCRQNRDLEEAVEWCHEHGIHLDAVNENLEEQLQKFPVDGRKIFATEYWDDRAVQIK